MLQAPLLLVHLVAYEEAACAAAGSNGSGRQACQQENSHRVSCQLVKVKGCGSGAMLGLRGSCREHQGS
jgi:hypothetical protein